jgi:hypothetical protein
MQMAGDCLQLNKIENRKTIENRRRIRVDRLELAARYQSAGAKATPQAGKSSPRAWNSSQTVRPMTQISFAMPVPGGNSWGAKREG